MSELRSRRNIFAVWRWPKWTWGIALLLMFAFYVLGIGPAEWLLVHGYLSVRV